MRQKLIASDGAYSELRSGPRRFLGVALQVGFPALLALAVISSLFHPDLLGAYVWPSLAMMAASAAFHARTRYRVAILPTLSLVAAKGAATAFETLQGPTSTALFLLGVNLLLAALLRINCSTERNL